MTVIPFPARKVARENLTIAEIFEAEISTTAPALIVWYQRHVFRHMLREELLKQPDSVLADVGITRQEATEEARKPFWME